MPRDQVISCRVEMGPLLDVELGNTIGPDESAEERLKAARIRFQKAEKAVSEAWATGVFSKVELAETEMRISQAEMRSAEKQFRDARKEQRSSRIEQAEAKIKEAKTSYDEAKRSGDAYRIGIAHDAYWGLKVEQAQKKYETAMRRGEHLLIEFWMKEWERAKAMCSDYTNAREPQGWEMLEDHEIETTKLPKSHSTSPICRIEIPWYVNKNEVRKMCAKAYGLLRERENLVQCCITRKWGDARQVVGVRILSLSTPQGILEELNLDGGKLWDVRNTLPLLWKIQKAFVSQRLCIVSAADNAYEALYRIKILDPSLAHERYRGSKTFKSLDGDTFTLPTLSDGTSCFTRLLSYHAQKSFEHAEKMNWVFLTDPRPVVYGSPLDCDSISFVADEKGGCSNAERVSAQ
ncbi:expressed unknown protein [Seminavis robusta]|uniref:HNH nuclease domain-containing protein n=1 Tax=Seminavis robusta TaxID=568900 RepID=A0A9N8H5N2_9STRA|nr:expressed unknown protein [Seminavis robusta]|eukprot:Sro78_g042500.1 n/a (406) ;mRNA; r:81265-82482